MTAERISELRAEAEAHPNHRSAKMILELCDEVRKLHARKRKPKQAFLFAPEIAELCVYGSTIGLTTQDCQDFYDHHQARGWKYKSGLPMCDWKAALRTWKRNQGRFFPAPGGNGEKVLSVSEQRSRRNGSSIMDCPRANAV